MVPPGAGLLSSAAMQPYRGRRIRDRARRLQTSARSYAALNPARLLPLLAASLLLSCASHAPVSPLTIVCDYAPFPSADSAASAERDVVWNDADPRDDEACSNSYAALELRRHLARGLGLKESEVRIAAPGRLPDAGTVVVLGRRGTNPLIAQLADAALSPSDPPGSFRLLMKHASRQTVIVLEGVDRAGTLYAAYDLIERLGVRFYGLGEGGVTYPATPAVLPRSLDVIERPAYTTRGFWAWEPRGNRDFFLWMARNRINLWTAADTAYVPLLRKLCIRLTGGGHTLQHQYLEPRRFFADHREWYGLHAGHRSPAIGEERGDNFCTSNPQALAAYVNGIVASLEEGRLREVDVLEAWMLDQGRWCECRSCAALGTPTDRALRVGHAIARAVREAHDAGRLDRAVEVSVPAFVETGAPPTAAVRDLAPEPLLSVTYFPYLRCYAHAYEDPACQQINEMQMEAWRGWTTDPERAYRGTVAVGEYYNISFSKSLPLLFPHVIGADLAAFHSRGVREFHYMHVPTSLWGPWTLQHAVLARLLWNPAVAVDSVLEDFLSARFPTTRVPMRAFYAHLERATANITALQFTVGVYGASRLGGGRLAEAGIPIFVSPHFPPAEVDQIAEAMRSARAAIDSAIAACRDSFELGRLAEDERRFAYGEQLLGFYDSLLRTEAAERMGRPELARVAFDRAVVQAEALRGIRDLVAVSSSHANARDGLEASQVENTFNYFRRRYGARH